jgi:S-adenosylmethionine hydrolase
MIIGSRGYLEIAVNCGNASQIIEVYKGDPVAVTLAVS